MNRRELLKYLSIIGFSWQQTKQAVSADDIARLDKAPTGIVYDEAYLQHIISPDHPESPERLLAVMQSIIDADLVQHRVLYPVKERSEVEQWIKTIHTEQHIASLKKRHPVSHDVLLRVISDVLSVTEAVCTRQITNAFCATRPPGHHAENTGKIEGFCLYNIIAIAARYAQQQHGLKKVLIIDWDYHHGNGTESAFYADPSVLFFSTHDWNAYPGTGDPGRRGNGKGEGYNINVHLPCGTTDEMILQAFESKLLPTANQFKPDIILISAGFDSRMDDRLGCFNITDNGFIDLTQLIRRLADQHCAGRIVSIMEGGYNISGNASAAVAHIKALME